MTPYTATQPLISPDDGHLLELALQLFPDLPRGQTAYFPTGSYPELEMRSVYVPFPRIKPEATLHVDALRAALNSVVADWAIRERRPGGMLRTEATACPPQQEPRIKTREQAHADFERKGVSISAWARQHKVGRSLVYEILTGTRPRTCSRGQSHRIAVLLGLKEGELVAGPEAVNAAGRHSALKRAA